MPDETLSGCALGAAVIGAEDLETSVAFYRDIIGLDVTETFHWNGAAFESLWHLPAGSSARAALCHHDGETVGQIMLVEFDAGERQPIRTGTERRAYSLFNVNFYTHDIRAAHRDLSAKGYSFWSEPVEHAFTDAVGAPIEVIFEGPDAVPVNLVELKGGGPDSRIGHMRRYLEAHGTTSTGYTGVVTSAHCMRERDRGVAFYEKVLGMSVIIDEELFSDEANHFLGTPAGARTHITFVQGDHMFGKIAMSCPVNYTPPDLIPRSEAPNIGYLAQLFRVPDLAKAEEACAAVEAEAYAPRQEIELPGLGPSAVAAVRNPGSGAITLLAQLS